MYFYIEQCCCLHVHSLFLLRWFAHTCPYVCIHHNNKWTCEHMHQCILYMWYHMLVKPEQRLNILHYLLQYFLMFLLVFMFEMSRCSKVNLTGKYAAGGRRTLYAGLTPTLVRAFPANAAQWLAWELSKRCEFPQFCCYCCWQRVCWPGDMPNHDMQERHPAWSSVCYHCRCLQPDTAEE